MRQPDTAWRALRRFWLVRHDSSLMTRHVFQNFRSFFIVNTVSDRLEPIEFLKEMVKMYPFSSPHFIFY